MFYLCTNYILNDLQYVYRNYSLLCLIMLADITLADFGRKEIDLAEKEMPGLMALREKYWRIQTVKRCPYHGIITL